MNNKVLASLGVIVAFLAAWLFVSMYFASSIIIAEDESVVVSPAVRMENNLNTITSNEARVAKTTIRVGGNETDIKTVVKIAE
jgi:hypothetical protein